MSVVVVSLEDLRVMIREEIRKEIQAAVSALKPQEAHLPAYLTLQEVADYCRVSKRTIDRYVSIRVLKTVQIGRRTRVARREVERFMAAGG